MAKEITEEKSVTVNTDKTPKVEVEKETTIAPVGEKPIVEEATEAPDAKDLSDVLMILNVMDKEVGGKGEITELPEHLRGSFKYLIDQITFVKNRFEDPLWASIMDDMKDQEEDGQTPSLEVAIARTIPMERLQELSDSEDYEGMQGELADGIAAQKQTDEEDVQYDANFQESQEAGKKYAAKMGYDEARTNELFQKVVDLMTIFGDGKLTEEEFADVDKMLLYGPDTEALRSELSTQGTKEVLPDQASIDATITKSNEVKVPTAPVNAPGMQSLGAYDDSNAKITNTGKRRRV